METKKKIKWNPYYCFDKFNCIKAYDNEVFFESSRNDILNLFLYSLGTAFLSGIYVGIWGKFCRGSTANEVIVGFVAIIIIAAAVSTIANFAFCLFIIPVIAIIVSIFYLVRGNLNVSIVCGIFGPILFLIGYTIVESKHPVGLWPYLVCFSFVYMVLHALIFFIRQDMSK